MGIRIKIEYKPKDGRRRRSGEPGAARVDAARSALARALSFSRRVGKRVLSGVRRSLVWLILGLVISLVLVVLGGFWLGAGFFLLALVWIVLPQPRAFIGAGIAMLVMLFMVLLAGNEELATTFAAIALGYFAVGVMADAAKLGRSRGAENERHSGSEEPNP